MVVRMNPPSPHDRLSLTLSPHSHHNVSPYVAHFVTTQSPPYLHLVATQSSLCIGILAFSAADQLKWSESGVVLGGALLGLLGSTAHLH